MARINVYKSTFLTGHTSNKLITTFRHTRKLPQVIQSCMKVSYTLICMRQDGILILLRIFPLHQFIPSLVFKHQLAE